jgi:hypothetical protein
MQQRYKDVKNKAAPPISQQVKTISAAIKTL